MFRYTSLKKQIMIERQLQLEKNTADIDYLAMMSDINLDTEKEYEVEDNNE